MLAKLTAILGVLALSACGASQGSEEQTIIDGPGDSVVETELAPQGGQETEEGFESCLDLYADWAAERGYPFFPSQRRYKNQMAQFASVYPNCAEDAQNPYFLAIAD